MVDDESERTPSVTKPLLHDGEPVGRYLLLDVVGEGGGGIVYRAFDPDLERMVALKLLRPVPPGSGSGGLSRDDLLREAKALARVAHPHVVSIFDVGTSGTDVFIALELVEGDTLRNWLAIEKRTRTAILDAFLAAGEGLAAAHAAGVVHRDFKPDNVIVGRDGRIRVLDFGIATAGAGGASARAPLDEGAPNAITSRDPDRTMSCTIIGTPRYMSPEQHLGEATDARTDEFSFCVSLYEALHGEHPFGGDDEPNTRINRVVTGAPVAPKSTDVPQWIRRVLLRGLSMHPSDRFQTMDALLRALRADPSITRRRWISRAGIALLSCAAVVGIVRASRERGLVCSGAESHLAGVWDAERDSAIRAALHATGAPYAEQAYLGAKRALDAYGQEWVAARKDACEATEVRHEQSAELLDLRMICLDDRLAAMRAQVGVLAAADMAVTSRAAQASQSLPSIASCSDAAALRAPVRLPSDPRTRARFDVVREETAHGRALNASGRYGDAQAFLDRAVADAHALGFRPAEAEAIYALGISHDRQGHYKEAEHTFNEAVLAGEAARSDLVVAQAWSKLAWVVGEREARYPEAIGFARHAHAMIERFDDRDAVLGELLDIESALSYREGRYDESVARGRDAFEHLKRAYGPAHALALHALTDVADAEVERGLVTEAIADYREVLRIQESTLGVDHPDVAATLNNEGIAFKRLRRFDEAIACYERALAIREKAFGPDHPQNAASLYNLGEVLGAAGHFDRALPLEQRALALLERHLGPRHPDVAEALYGVAETLRALGKDDEAGEAYARALAIDEETLGATHPALAAPLTGLGEIACAEHRPSDAIAPLSRALALREAGPPDPTALASTRFALGRALWESSRDKKRGRALVATARTELASLGDSAASDLVAIDAWVSRTEK